MFRLKCFACNVSLAMFRLEYDNRIQPVLYDCTILAKNHDLISVIDSEETLTLAEDSRSKMNEKQKDPIFKEKKQAFWLPISKPVSEQPVVQPVPVNPDVPRELPSRSLVKTSFQKLKSHIDNFEKVVKEFDKGLDVEIKEMKAVFNQMESEVEQYIVHTVVNSYAAIVDYQKMEKSFVDEYNECVELKAELSKKNEMDAPEFKEYFEINNLKAQLKGKDTTINNLKKHIANLKEKVVADCGTPVESQSKHTTNKPLLPSTRVISSTSASGSKSKSNTRKNRITQVTSSNQKNKKVEDHHRSVMSSLNKKNHVSICNASTKHVVLDANSIFVYSTCKDCLLSANHDQCIVTYLNDVNSRVKSKSGKRKKKELKPTGKVFTSVGHRWLPTGRTFTIDETKCPLTRITSTKVVPPRESVQTTVITKTQSSSVPNRKPKVTKSLSPSNEPSILGPRHSNNSEPNRNWGSNILNSPSSSRVQRSKFMGTVRFGNDQVARIMGYGDYQIGNVIIYRVYYVEGLGHNLFSVGQFCDSDLELLRPSPGYGIEGRPI
ncbi:hypothetical protein Tco_0687761 [Tanacetum coccineum]